MGLLDWIGMAPRSAAVDQEALARIASALTDLDPVRARYLAAFAYLLGRVALADQQFSDAERGAMVRMLMEEGALPSDQAELVVEIAREQNRLFHGTEDFRITQEFKDTASEEQKLALIRCLFAVCASDAAVVTAEDNEIRRISIEIKVPHEEFVRVRSAWRERLSVLKPGAGIRPAAPEAG